MNQLSFHDRMMPGLSALNTVKHYELDEYICSVVMIEMRIESVNIRWKIFAIDNMILISSSVLIQLSISVETSLILLSDTTVMFAGDTLITFVHLILHIRSCFFSTHSAISYMKTFACFLDSKTFIAFSGVFDHIKII